MGMDLFIPKKKVDESELNEETLESFVVRRMGRECLDRLAEPLVGGVHASDPAKMSLAATFPRLLAMEQAHRSLIAAFVESRKKVAEMRKKYPPDPKNPRTFFTSFKGGMQQLTDAMADAAGRDNARTGVQATSILKEDGRWRVDLSDGTAIVADGVVIATEGWAAAELLGPIDGKIGDALSEIPHSSSATVSLAFDEATVGVDMNAFGVLCPLVEGRSIMAATFSSTKWPGRAPKGRVLFRGFVGGPHNQAIMERTDNELVEIVLSELRAIVGVKGEPLLSRVYRWNAGMPQYTIGHLDRVALLGERLADIPGLGVGGGSYTGVGVPNCIESGEAAVSKVCADLGVVIGEDSAEPEKRHY
jgi:oxygen-dependent protoporphyrinogen oxidase